jgi:transcription-repair coupling factor (superfamily II helicase)
LEDAKKIQVEGKTQEAIKTVYADNDIVYVCIHSCTKFKIQRKRRNATQNLQIRVECLEDFKTKQRHGQTYAFNLIQVVCQKKTRKRIPVCAGQLFQNELESSFIYEDTPNQIYGRSKADMESDRPMDRLVCGDVGFGKRSCHSCSQSS